jgi:hypothetical protein
MPRQDLRKIGARDRHAAAKIAEVRHAHPEAVILVVFGESHLAPNHLPRLLRDQLKGERVITILQNVDSLYWQAAGESCERVEAVRVADDVVCVFNATPLEKYENYRLCLDRWSREGLGSPDLGPTIYNLINGLLQFLGMDAYSPHNSTQPKFLVDALPEVYARNSDAMLRKLLSRRGVDEYERKLLLRYAEERGSVYLPHANVLYVRDFRMMEATEEAARFLHHACRGLPRRVNGHVPAPLEGPDLFYAKAIEHAVGYFGSRVLCPSRPPARESELYELYDETREDVEQRAPWALEEFIELVDLLALHRGFELNPKRYRELPQQIERGVQLTGDKLEYVTQQLGYMLGSEIYDAYVHGDLSRRYLKSLFLVHIDQPGVAPQTYFNIVRRVRTGKR